MLKEIKCIHFTQPTISFHHGLNVILGDDDAKNSIGKSTVLMIIDFVFGGSSMVADASGAIRELGHHHYDFAFEFDRVYHFSRATDDHRSVYVCDSQYVRQSVLPLSEFCAFLKNHYGMESMSSSFRDLIGPFARIWKKGGLETDQPFVGIVNEAHAKAIARLIDLFGRTGEIAVERDILKGLTERLKLVNSSMNEDLIPRITKGQRAENLKKISEYSMQMEQLQSGLGGAIATYESLFDEALQKMQHRKAGLMRERAEVNNTIRRLERELAGLTPRLTANISLVADFFPNVDVGRLAQVEAFHHKIGKIVKQELKAELAQAQATEHTLTQQVASIESEISAALAGKGMPDDIFSRLFDLKEATDRAINENRHYDRAVDLKDSIRLGNNRLSSVYDGIFTNIEHQINERLRAFNRVVYGPTRASSSLRITAPDSYRFTSHADTGTGKSYAGLVAFDLAMLSLTPLPMFIHDSIIYKNIEVPATQRILRIFFRVKAKQIFISFDEAKKFGTTVEASLNASAVLKLTRHRLLYTKDWRDQDQNQD